MGNAPTRKESVFSKIKARYTAEDLDEEVHGAMSEEATDICNRGIDAQLEYLAGSWGLDVLESYFVPEEDKD